MTKKERQQVFEKYGGKCAYCGCDLQKGWHVDHMEPIRRNFAHVGGTSIDDTGNITWEPVRKVEVTPCHPERECFDNYMPACASCNVNKHSGSIEDFRRMISGFINSLNRYSTQYKIAKRYGLIQEEVKPVQFYFETLSADPTTSI